MTPLGYSAGFDRMILPVFFLWLVFVLCSTASDGDKGNLGAACNMAVVPVLGSPFVFLCGSSV